MAKKAKSAGSKRVPANTTSAGGAVKIYYISAYSLGDLGHWPEALRTVREMGFSHVCVSPLFAPHAEGGVFLTADHEASDPVLKAQGTADQAASQIAALCRENGLQLIVDIVLDRIARDGATAQEKAALFRPIGETGVVDPRAPLADVHGLIARFGDPACADLLVDWWTERLSRLVANGVAGFRILGLEHVPTPIVRRIVDGVKARAACLFLAWTPGLDWSRYGELATAHLDGVFASTPWWDGRAAWYVQEHEALRRIAPVIGVAEAPFADRIAARAPDLASRLALGRRSLWTAAATGDGLLVPMGFESLARRPMDPRGSESEEAEGDLSKEVAAANGLVDRISASGLAGELRGLTSPTSPVGAFVRGNSADMRDAARGMAILINGDLFQSHEVPVSLDPIDPSAGAPLGNPAEASAAPLAPGEVRVAFLSLAKPVREPGQAPGGNSAARQPRIVVDRVTPHVAGGAFAVKRVVGRSIEIEADVFADGHDVLAAEILWKAVDEEEWRRSPLAPIGNDRWRGTIVPARIGRHVFTIEAWWDGYATLCRALELKHRAGISVASELLEARDKLRALAQKKSKEGGILAGALAALDANDEAAAVLALIAPDTRNAVAALDERVFAVQHESSILDIDRPQAEFASWYELFPRSQTDDPARHGTFADVIGVLPRIRAMGFDVLYFPPIHPIGVTNRKGPNNTLTVGPTDPGSPYAIGSADGGHDAIHRELGTIEDFRRLVAAARENGLEIALDFAIQCSLDHPWLREHPDWFRHEADGSIKYAENPPKKYEDIVNVDFYARGAVPGLWEALRDVVLHWADEGVRTFRVDNPHTKPLPFWQWLIADVRGRHPDTIFLSEAFTRPTMMYRLAKVGFTQSYTYFTWRNTKQEFIDYMTELATTEVVEFFRPNFFVNTPDINPIPLQTSGRAGFLIRAALAATLSGLWGVYSGFEICEAAPLPGREEYLDSEKYQIRVRDFTAPGNIVGEITALNRIRKAHPALHSHLGVRFYNAFNDQVLYYGKPSPGGEDMILVVINLDPHNVQEATFEVPLWEWHLPDHESVSVESLMTGERFVWTGKIQHLRLDPAALPFAIWRIAPLNGGRL